MLDPRTGTALYRAAASRAAPGGATADRALLERFARDHDPGAFTELLARHGPTVWAVCRRATRTEADAEDAFQATFLVLARRAARVRKAASVGSWLYGVATRIGRKARARADRAPDPARLMSPSPAPPPDAGLSWSEVRAALDEELAQLPDDLRAVVLLCYFQGLTQDETAAQLGWTARTVKARVARARGLLRARLTRRGIELAAALAVPLLTADAGATVPPHLRTALASFATDMTRGARTGPRLPPSVVALARTEVSTVKMIRLVALCATAAGLMAAGMLSGRPPTSPTGSASAAAPVAAPPAPEPPPKIPAAGVRIGTTEFRQVGWHSRVFFANDGKTLVTAGEGAVVRFWDIEHGKTTHEIQLKGLYNDAAATPSGDLLAVVGTHWPKGKDQDSECVLWLIDTPRRTVRHTVALPPRLGGNSQKVALSADGRRAVVEQEGDVQVIDTKSGEELMRHKDRINAGTLAVSRDGKRIAFGRHDLYLWEWESGEEPRKLASRSVTGVETAGFAPDGKTLLAVTDGGLVAAFDVTTGQRVRTLDLGGPPWKWSFSPDGRTLAVVCAEQAKNRARGRAVVLWDPITGTEVGRFPVGQTEAKHVSWSADGARLAAVTDYRLWVWDVKTGKPIGPSSPGHEGHVSGLAFGPDGRLFSASDDHTIRSWSPTTGKPELELIHDSWVRGVAVSPDGALVAGSALLNDLRIWDAKTGAEQFRLLGNGRLGGTRRVQFTPDGRRLVAWGDDMYLRVWSARNGKLVSEHRTVPDGLTEAQLDDPWQQRFMFGRVPADISSDCSTFALPRQKNVKIFDVSTGKERAKFEIAPNGGVTALALSPNGKLLAANARGDGSETHLPDGRTQYTAASENRTSLWDVTTQKVVWKATSLGSETDGLAFSPDGKLLAEVTMYEKDYVVRVRETASGKELGRIALPTGGSHVAFDRTGRRLAVANWDTTATVYDLDTALKPVALK
ncbi:sigma-70 family RNA polymerase sigma factor [Gemmata sp. JC673]|uniref:Sigma-70 family RNA polymerase sigma factor n=1 Tax=Gemmata algarum TaxID=2975278 RepID=A0ABU5FAE7_9BACT|nr:sigma-70 family RNA polymerase sigma factor [Gemmata algarum]MDY3562811.1 sigma-70 family RNA polymerase sigma factor [Gemmata algarum]